jgi:hypothetical protein
VIRGVGKGEGDEIWLANGFEERGGWVRFCGLWFGGLDAPPHDDNS